MKKLGVVFAGQGSQSIGMGLDFAHYNPTTKHKLDQASLILGYDVEKVLNSENNEINQTIYTQPLMFLATIFAFDELIKLKVDIKGMCGFSLGEYSAFYGASIFSYENLLKIVNQRAKFMHDESQRYPGKMAAIIGLESSLVHEICEKTTEGIVVVANYNSPIQTVISGEEKAVLKAIDKLKEIGAKRAIPLNVSGAFHSPLMKEAGQKLFDAIKHIESKEPIYDVYMNTTGKQLVYEDIKVEMKNQIFSPVLFNQSILEMKKKGFTHFIEVGPGTVLSGLIKKIDVNLEVTNLSKVEDLERVKGWLIEHGFKK